MRETIETREREGERGRERESSKTIVYVICKLGRDKKGVNDDTTNLVIHHRRPLLAQKKARHMETMHLFPLGFPGAKVSGVQVFSIGRH